MTKNDDIKQFDFFFLNEIAELALACVLAVFFLVSARIGLLLSMRCIIKVFQ